MPRKRVFTRRAAQRRMAWSSVSAPTHTDPGARCSLFRGRVVVVGVHLVASYAEGASDAYRRQHASVDPVADRLRGDLELLGDLRNGEELSLPRG